MTKYLRIKLKTEKAPPQKSDEELNFEYSKRAMKQLGYKKCHECGEKLK